MFPNSVKFILSLNYKFKSMYIIFRVKEYWIPNRDDLDELVVTRDVPTIHILLSKDVLDENEPGSV